MYYVIQVAPREEKNIESLIQDLLPSNVCRQCFHLRRHILKKYHGEWHDVHEKLLPGYVFVETDDIEHVRYALQKIDRFAKILGKENEDIFALGDEDVAWLECLIEKSDNYEVALSRVELAVDGTVKFVSGPLKTINRSVEEVNLHKRIAKVQMCLGDRKVVIHLGIYIDANDSRYARGVHNDKFR